MRLKRLEISGFKSFAKKAVLDFSAPVTAIVGPNGSGKSNVVEAVRFVLGEQSMKSMRGKSGSDLIFNGSKGLSKGNHASVAIVFDNKQRIFKLPQGASEISLDFDEIALGREVWSDGLSRYSINGTEVRLKDVLEVLAGVNIGTSSHHIISQGETDRILLSSPRQRREMLEDALGLKVYHYRLRESERKIEKTKENLKEAEILRREIAPHLNFLRKQMEKVEKAKVFREELENLYREYFQKEEFLLKKEKHALEEERSRQSSLLGEIEKNLAENRRVEEREENTLPDKLEDLNKKAKEIQALKDDLLRKLGRVEGMLELEEKRAKAGSSQPGTKIRSISVGEIEKLLKDIENLINKALSEESLEEINPILKNIKEAVAGFLPAYLKKSEPEAKVQAGDLEALMAEQNKIQTEVGRLDDEEKKLRTEISAIRGQIDMEKKASYEKDKAIFELEIRKKEAIQGLENLKFREEALAQSQNSLQNEREEGRVLVGPQIFDFSSLKPASDVSRQEQEDKRKKIERLKIKLEDIGAGGGSEISKEFNEVSERDQFLSKEIDDLKQSIKSLEELSKNLIAELETEFKAGIEKINKQFQEFFEILFDGGKAYISVVAVEKRGVEEGEEGEEASEEEHEEGIDIEVSLPKKKVKGLHMLSGGERSLVSIALLFAISQVNPPPFLILDETDAALDEANSRKYGDMLENLARYSQLIVVTHNRETMSRAQVLFGVTIGTEGASKLLSVKLEEAVAIAK
jgi:chromosome segregation protein